MGSCAACSAPPTDAPLPYASPQPWCPPCFAHRPPTRPARPPTRPHHTQRSLQGAYNAILAGAAFMDSATAFAAYSSPDAAPCRGMVDRLRNCDDLLLNFVVATASLAAGGSAAAQAALRQATAGGDGAATAELPLLADD